MNTVTKEVADTVRAELARRRLTVSDLVPVLGISRSSIARRLNGSHPFNVAELIALAGLLELPASDLMPALPAA